jgi:hypothetical protein
MPANESTTPLGDALAAVDRAQNARPATPDEADQQDREELRVLRLLAEAVRAHLNAQPERPPAARAEKYTHDQLHAAFNLVKPPGNWKMPVDATVPEGTDLEAVTEALLHFTGSPATFITNLDGSVHVLAAGYYACIGALPASGCKPALQGRVRPRPGRWSGCRWPGGVLAGGARRRAGLAGGRPPAAALTRWPADTGPPAAPGPVRGRAARSWLSHAVSPVPSWSRSAATVASVSRAWYPSRRYVTAVTRASTGVAAGIRDGAQPVRYTTAPNASPGSLVVIISSVLSRVRAQARCVPGV